jgi:hypothetical protein
MVDENGEILPEAIGFLVTINGIFHLVTTKYIIFDKEKDSFTDSGILMFFN